MQNEIKINDISEQVFAGVCRGNCTGGCFLNIHVRDGKVVRTSARELPNPEYNRICTKGLTHMHRMYSSDRLKYPQKRVGKRGEGKWERITWEEAIETIAEKWSGYQRDFGSNAFAIMWGSGNYATVSGAGMGSAINRLQNVTGASKISITSDFGQGRAAGNATGWGPNFAANESADLLNAKTIICWGANPTVSQLHNTHFIMQAKEKGAKYIVIDVTYNANASKADMFVPVRPGSDGALAMAMMNIVIREGWQDKEFLKASTVAPFLVKATDGMYLRYSDLAENSTPIDPATDSIVVMAHGGNVGKSTEISDPLLEGTFTVNGIEVTTAYSLLLKRIAEYTPEKASEITNVPVETIEELARLYATDKPSTIYQFFGVDHYVNGHYSISCIYALSMLTGNMCKEGASAGMGEYLGTNVTNFVGALFPAGAPGPGPEMVITEIGNVIDTGMYGDVPINLKGAFITMANPVANMSERKKTLEWMNKMEFIVVSDLSMTETAKQADILLPSAHWFEATDAFCSYHTHPHIMWQDKAVDPPFECKSDFDIIKLISAKMGLGHHFDMTEEEYIALWLDSDGAKAMGITMEKLREEKALRHVPGPNYIEFAGGNFLTPTGRAQFYLEAVAPDYNIGQEWDIEKERLPHWEAPNEAWSENLLHAKYPLVIVSENSRLKTHSQWTHVTPLVEIDVEPYVKIHPVDAAKYGIKNGDTVRLYNDRGHVVMKAYLNTGMQPGVLSHPRGWEADQFIDGHFQDLPSGTLNPVCANQAYYDVLCAIEKL